MRFELVLAAAAAFMSSSAGATDGFEGDVLRQINWARAHPEALAAALRVYREAFDGRIVRERGDRVGVVTQEGAAAVDEAIAFLARQPALPPLGNGLILARVAASWVAAQGAIGARGHGAIGARMRAGGGDIYVGETISYGMRTAAGVVRQLIVDDGVPSRGHRTLLFAARYRYAGVGCGGHVRYGTMCVIDLAETADGTAAVRNVAAAQPSRVSAFSR